MDDQSTRNKNNHDHQVQLLLPLDLNNMSNSFTGLFRFSYIFHLIIISGNYTYIYRI